MPDGSKRIRMVYDVKMVECFACAQIEEAVEAENKSGRRPGFHPVLTMNRLHPRYGKAHRHAVRAT